MSIPIETPGAGIECLQPSKSSLAHVPLEGIGRDKQNPDVGTCRRSASAAPRAASPAVGNVAVWALPMVQLARTPRFGSIDVVGGLHSNAIPGDGEHGGEHDLGGLERAEDPPTDTEPERHRDARPNAASWVVRGGRQLAGEDGRANQRHAGAEAGDQGAAVAGVADQGDPVPATSARPALGR